MKINQKTTVKSMSLAVCLIAVSTFAFSGCRSGGLTKPDFGKLAFWKKAEGSATSTPPPPARHFDPSPIDGAQQQIAAGTEKAKDQMAKVDGSGTRNMYESNKDSIRNDVESAIKGMGTGGLQPPVRKSSSVADAQNSVRSKLDGFSSGAKSALNAEQKEFKAAMSGSGSKNDSGSNDFGSSNDFAPTNSFASRTAEASKDLTKGWKDIETPTGLSEAANSINQSLANARNATYDANGKLASSASKVKDSFVAKANELSRTTNNALAHNGFSANSFATPNSNGFGASAPMTKESTPPPLTVLTPKPTAPALSNFGGTPAATTNTGQSQALMAQVAEAKMQIEQLKAQVAQAKLAQAQKMAAQPAQGFAPQQFQPQTQTAPQPFQPQTQMAQQPLQTQQPFRQQQTFQPQTTSQPATRTAQLQVPPFSNQTSVSNSSLASGLPNNVLRSSSDSLRAPQAPATTANNFTPGYSSTGQGGFSASSNGFGSNGGSNSRPTANSQVNFENSQQPTSNSFYANGGNAGSATRIQNHVSDIDIPASVLSGTGSYAPGSVNALKSK